MNRSTFKLLRCLGTMQKRSTWVFAQAKHLPVTPQGSFQRPPNEKQDYQCYDVLRNEDETETPLRIVLNSYVEELGNWGDVVETSRANGRILILTGQADYASPFHLTRIENERKLLGDNVPPRISLHALKTARELSASVLDVPLSLHTEWILELWHIKAVLRQRGFWADDSSIVMPKSTLIGPDLKLESKLFRFYLLINSQVVVPMLGRIHHVSDDSKEVLRLGVQEGVASDQELRAQKISPQKITILDSKLAQPTDVWSSDVQEKIKA